MGASFEEEGDFGVEPSESGTQEFWTVLGSEEVSGGSVGVVVNVPFTGSFSKLAGNGGIARQAHQLKG